MARLVRLSGIVLLALIAGLALGAKAPSAEAHAWLDHSRPAAGEVVQTGPPEVLLWFTEDIDIGFSYVQVLNSSGARVDNDDFHTHSRQDQPGITMQINVPNGTYTVIWDVLSVVDGHRTKGSFAYFVGAPDSVPGDSSAVSISLSSGPPQGLQVAVRWLNFIAMALLIGAATAPFLVLVAGFDALGDDGENDEAEMDAAALVRLTVLGAAVLIVIGSGLSLWLQVWSAGGSATATSAIGNVLSDTRFGDIWFVRIALAGAALLFSMMAFGGAEPPWRRSILARENTSWVVLVLAALMIPVTTSLNSHAAAGGDASIQTLVDWAHLVVGGIWVGGLVILLLVMALITPYITDRAVFLGSVVRRFSTVAVPTVTLVVATGVVQSIGRLGGIGQLVDSNYGYTLLAKVILLAPLLALGAVNLLIIGPRFRAFAEERSKAMLSRLPRWEERFWLAVLTEVTLAAVILGATALLTNTAPPRGAQDVYTYETLTTNPGNTALGTAIKDDLDITVWADPGTAGTNEVNVLINDLNGDWKDVQKIIVRFKNLDQDLGESEAEAKPIHPPVHFIATTTQMSLAGKWQVEVIVRREGLLDTQAQIPITIAP